MSHLPSLVQDLALILMVAGAMTLIFRALGQPVVLGYIVAGFLVGPNISWIPSIVDGEGVKVWAEIGVIFLLFALGLEFSFKKLASVGQSASITALFELLGMIGIGFLIGKLFSWSFTDSLFLGGILSISSTTIIFRAFDELGMKARGFVPLVFGVLIIEDLVAILLMVVLTTVAVSQTFSGLEMATSAAKLIFFLTLWFVLGIFLIPSLFKYVRKLLNEESLLVLALGLCFLMVVLAAKAGFSPALGAFIMGSILSETVEGQRIEHLIQPVKDLFAAVFFVSVGMLIDPKILSEFALPIVVITMATILGKIITTSLGALISGHTLRHSVQSGMSLAQIGEFSFIIAGLGTSLNVTSKFLYPIAISVSAITTFTTPYLIRSADPMVNWLERSLPKTWLESLARFSSASILVTQTSDWKILLRRSAVKILPNAVIISAIFLLSSEYLVGELIERGFHPRMAAMISLMLSFAVCSPFMFAVSFGKLGKAEARLWSQRRYQAPMIVFQAGRVGVLLSLLAVLSSRFVSIGVVGTTYALIVLVSAIFLSRHVSKVYEWIERRFVLNLNEKKDSSKNSVLPPLAPWDSHLVEFKVSPDSRLVGKSLQEAKIREQFGITVALIERGSTAIPAPGSDFILYPHDLLHVIGNDEQIFNFKQQVASGPQVSNTLEEIDYILHSIDVSEDAPYAGKSIRDCGLRELLRGLVVGIEKRGQRLLNPDSSTVIEAGDIIWVVGDRELIRKMNS